MSCLTGGINFEEACPPRTRCSSPSSTPEELERRALIQRNDLLLHEAVIKNETEGVKRILQEPVDINSRNNYGRAPIHWASARGNIDIMEMLIAANCDIEARDKYGMRPLLMACWHGHKDAVQLLINTGACSSATNKKHFTLLMCAARNDRLDVIEFLIDTLEDVRIDAIDIDGQTALFHAALGGHVNVVRLLIEMGANVDKRNKECRSALHLACERGHVEVADVLLTHEADMEAKDMNGDSPLHLASQQQRTEIVQLLLEAGADPDSENTKGLTPLHTSSSLGSKGILEALLQFGATLNKQNKQGNTPLHLASHSNLPSTVELLIGRGADLNSLNLTPIHIAAEMGYTEICKLLLAAGANIEQREHGGRTPLYIAARGSFTAIVDMIIRTSRLDFPSQLEVQDSPNNVNRSVPRTQLWPCSQLVNNERLREVLYRVAYKQLAPGEWKMLANHWAFTQEQIKAIEHQYNGPSSYKEHGFRMMLIWSHGLPPDANPLKEIYEGLTAVGKRPLADNLRRKIDQQNECLRKGKRVRCCQCRLC